MRWILLPALLSACAASGGSGDATGGGDELPSDCAAETYRDLVGQPASALDTAEFPRATRIIHPGDAVTMDYNPARLNVEIGEDGTVARLRCG